MKAEKTNTFSLGDVFSTLMNKCDSQANEGGFFSSFIL